MSRKLIAWLAATVAGIAAQVVVMTAALFLTGALPGAQAEAATTHSCVGHVCMDLQEVPDGKLPQGHNVLAKFSTLDPSNFNFDHYNVRNKSGAQVEICGKCAWTFYAKPGGNYSFSVQGCLQSLAIGPVRQ